VAAVRREVFAIDKSLPISNVTTMETLVDDTLSGSRFNGVAMSALASCALLLAAIGIYAVLSYVVTQRRTEIGLRMAMGATPAEVARLIGRDGLGAVLTGAAVGIGTALWLRNALAKMLFGITGADPAAYGFAVAALTLVAVAACVVPAWRAASTDPAKALQSR
jgi:ABC-type antimicrobial peptide transport system permease subunit